MKSIGLFLVLVLQLALVSGCVSSVKSTVDRSRGNTAFYNNKNYSAAADFYRSAASNGDAESAYMLSRILLSAEYGMQNIGEGLNWLNQAAAAGNVSANRDLGVFYMTGKHGMEKSALRSFPYLEAGAAQNDEVCVMALAMIYGSGMGVDKNPVQAARWFAKGRELGLPFPADMSNPDVVAALQPLPDKGRITTVQSVRTKNLVQEVQTLLTQLGYNPGPADGVAGKNTRQAVREFQKKRGLKVTGEINSQLLEQLQTALAND